MDKKPDLQIVGDKRRVRKDPDHWVRKEAEDLLVNFHTATRNSHDHHTKVSMNVPPLYTSICEQMMGYFPEYRSPADVYRDCLYIGLSLRMKQTQDGAISKMMALEKLEHDSQYRSNRRAQERQVVNTYKSELDDAVRDRYWRYVDESLGQIEEYLETADTSSPHVVELQRIYEQFKPHMQRASDDGHVSRADWKKLEMILDLNELDAEDD